MIENTPVFPASGGTAGAMLRAAREQQGIHIAVLAAAIKISPRKLDALEGDRYSELPDASFTRALAQTVARALKLDPRPVLALLPPVSAAAGLEAVGDGLNTPFKGRSAPNELSALLPRGPLIWAGLALLAAAALLLYWPYRQAAVTASTARSTTALPPPVTDPVATMPAVPTAIPPASPAAAVKPPSATAPSAAGVAAAPGANAIPQAAGSASASMIDPSAALPGAMAAGVPATAGATVTVSEPVWLEVVDGTGAVVFMRTIQPGEVVNFDQKLPLKLKIGNAAAAKVAFRGETIDLFPVTRANVARVVLK